jgi:hypothetical protein
MQTSIEWFIEHLLGNGFLRLTKENHSLYSELRDKAKEMHKQEIIDAVNEGIKEGYRDYIDTEWGRKHDYNPEQYYLETFRKD